MRDELPRFDELFYVDHREMCIRDRGKIAVLPYRTKVIIFGNRELSFPDILSYRSIFT